MNKYDALIAEAGLYDNSNGLMGAPGSQNALVCDLISRLATALREAQAHVPPEGWRVTEYAREDNSFVEQRSRLGHSVPVWRAFQATDDMRGCIGDFPTAAAAMAAIEEMSK